MLIEENILENLTLLLNQRLSLQCSRYVGMQQLLQHDLSILTNLTLFQPYSDNTALPDWLRWLYSDQFALLPMSYLTEFAEPDNAWLLLTELKLRYQRTFLSWFKQYLVTVPTLHAAAEQTKFWTLALRIKHAVNPFECSGNLCPEALWYIAGIAQPALVEPLLQWQQGLTDASPLYVHCQLALYSYGIACDEAALSRALLSVGQLDAKRLMLLLCGANQQQQSHIINMLIHHQSTQDLAVLAMGMSGRLKFVSLLTELVSQPEMTQAAQDSLAMLLGVVAADGLVSDGHFVTNNKVNAITSMALPNASLVQYLAGQEISSQALASAWQSGNQYHRRLAASHARLASQSHCLLDADAFMGAIWHP